LSNRLTVPNNLLETLYPGCLVFEQPINVLLLHAAITHILSITAETLVDTISFFVVIVDERGSCAAITTRSA
jgi:hypothetical protein